MRPTTTRIFANKYLYLMLAPLVAYLIVFCYVPIYGIVLAFKDFNIRRGILGSPWAGVRHFQFIATDLLFQKAFLNTVIISIGRLAFEFPVPIILAVLLNETRSARFSKVCQTIYTFPHFISWVVVAGLVSGLLSSSGAVSQLMQLIKPDAANLQTDPSRFRGLLYFSSNWKEAGWGTIIYLAAIASINVELYESADIDGANKWHKIRFITWPAILPTVCILLILKVGSMMSAGFDQIINMYNPAVMDVSDIIDTYVYRRTFQGGLNFSDATAIGLFKSMLNVVLLLAVNMVIRRAGEESLF